MKVLVVSADRSDDRGTARNLGDALLTDALVGALRGRGLDASALDLGGAGRARADAGAAPATGGEHPGAVGRPLAPRVAADGLRAMAAAIGAVDAVVLGGGTLFADDRPDARFAGLPRLCLAASGFARMRGARFATFGVGADPLPRARARAAIRFAAGRGPVWVRDVDSARRVEVLTGVAPRLAADVSLLGRGTVAAAGRSALAGRIGIPPRQAASAAAPAPAAPAPVADDLREGAVVALNRVEAAQLRPADIHALARAHGPVRFLSMHQGTDADAAALAPGTLAALDEPPAAALTWADAAALVGAARVVVASRMHAMYLGAMTGTPIAALAPTPKTRSFADEFDVPVVTRVAEAAAVSGRADAAALDRAAARGADALEELVAWLRS